MSAIAGVILTEFPTLNEAQREAIAGTKGPLLAIAGPGSGKTLVPVLRTLNILLRGLSDPGGILLLYVYRKSGF